MLRIRDSQGGTLRLVIYHDIDVIVDPERSYGHPMVDDIPVEDVIDRVRTGASYRGVVPGHRGVAVT